MLETVAESLTAALAIYATCGALFGVAFALRGAARIDPAAAGGTWGFRLLVLPGAAALWPYLAWRWMRGAGPPEERNAHRDRARRQGALDGEDGR